jgi:hypothetical protein
VNTPVMVGCLVAGMTAGADSIDDMGGLLRHRAMDALLAESAPGPRSARTFAATPAATHCS